MPIRPLARIRTSSRPRGWLLPLAASALVCLACQPPDSGAGEAAPAKAGADDKQPAPEAKQPAPEAKQPAPAANDEFSAQPTPEAAPSPAPPWFDPNAFEHVAIVRQDQRASKLPTGQSSSMIVLELPAGTTAEQCIENARAKLGETISDLPASATMPQGYLELRGKTDTFEYTIVCGVAKDKPSMFLSYTQ
ncbi:hypothetical protein ENSA5_32640 [Enhygromyxa salina]|uniref:Uncharacterized protein n=1 Tax=Enhygromyxa salina TaxID=215803 RepID=A0A2S9XXX0_9BACT|nr:hypothetical protein [Enhygromyxa salina]PRP97571.1 hypothetical protein ENSA5_32640 [Enhygromyxa salina]